jgi:hypothetical protein
MNRELRLELYLALVLLGADQMLLGALEAWREGADDRDVVADLRNWNEAKRLEIEEWVATLTESELQSVQQRIRHYEEARQALKRAA